MNTQSQSQGKENNKNTQNMTGGLQGDIGIRGWQYKSTGKGI
jgi:hypothetical protein